MAVAVDFHLIRKFGLGEISITSDLLELVLTAESAKGHMYVSFLVE